MALYMIRSHLKPENRDEVLKRYADAPDAMDGITQVGDWVSLIGDGAYHLMETDDPANIMDELLKYTDKVTYTVDPVITTDAFFSLLKKHKLS